jgi:hypothetical protein
LAEQAANQAKAAQAAQNQAAAQAAQQVTHFHSFECEQTSLELIRPHLSESSEKFSIHFKQIVKIQVKFPLCRRNQSREMREKFLSALRLLSETNT